MNSIIILFILLFGQHSVLNTKPRTMGVPYVGTTKTARMSTKAHEVYHYSVVPGGVWTPIQAGLPGGKLEKVTKSFKAYVNYRRNGRVLWTRKQLMIRAGEYVVADGKNMVRARCGNRISLVPMIPTEAVDITGELDTVQPVLLDIERLEEFRSSLIEKPTTSGYTAMTPFWLPTTTPIILCCTDGGHVPHTPHVPVSEADGLLMVIVAGAFILFVICLILAGLISTVHNF